MRESVCERRGARMDGNLVDLRDEGAEERHGREEQEDAEDL
jgi:hypothetical protein